MHENLAGVARLCSFLGNILDYTTKQEMRENTFCTRCKLINSMKGTVHIQREKYNSESRTRQLSEKGYLAHITGSPDDMIQSLAV